MLKSTNRSKVSRTWVSLCCLIRKSTVAELAFWQPWQDITSYHWCLWQNHSSECLVTKIRDYIVGFHKQSSPSRCHNVLLYLSALWSIDTIRHQICITLVAYYPQSIYDKYTKKKQFKCVKTNVRKIEMRESIYYYTCFSATIGHIRLFFFSKWSAFRSLLNLLAEQYMYYV